MQQVDKLVHFFFPAIDGLLVSYHGQSPLCQCKPRWKTDVFQICMEKLIFIWIYCVAGTHQDFYASFLRRNGELHSLSFFTKSSVSERLSGSSSLFGPSPWQPEEKSPSDLWAHPKPVPWLSPACSIILQHTPDFKGKTFADKTPFSRKLKRSFWNLENCSKMKLSSSPQPDPHCTDISDLSVPLCQPRCSLTWFCCNTCFQVSIWTFSLQPQWWDHWYVLKWKLRPLYS